MHPGDVAGDVDELARVEEVEPNDQSENRLPSLPLTVGYTEFVVPSASDGTSPEVPSELAEREHVSRRREPPSPQTRSASGADHRKALFKVNDPGHEEVTMDQETVSQDSPVDEQHREYRTV